MLAYIASHANSTLPPRARFKVLDTGRCVKDIMLDRFNGVFYLELQRWYRRASQVLARHSKLLAAKMECFGCVGRVEAEQQHYALQQEAHAMIQRRRAAAGEWVPILS